MEIGRISNYKIVYINQYSKITLAVLVVEITILLEKISAGFLYAGNLIHYYAKGVKMLAK